MFVEVTCLSDYSSLRIKQEATAAFYIFVYKIDTTDGEDVPQAKILPMIYTNVKAENVRHIPRTPKWGRCSIESNPTT